MASSIYRYNKTIPENATHCYGVTERSRNEFLGYVERDLRPDRWWVKAVYVERDLRPDRWWVKAVPHKRKVFSTRTKAAEYLEQCHLALACDDTTKG